MQPPRIWGQKIFPEMPQNVRWARFWNELLLMAGVSVTKDYKILVKYSTKVSAESYVCWLDEEKMFVVVEEKGEVWLHV